MEDHDELQGNECLWRFDKRLVAAIDKLKERGRWEELVNDGGSPEAVLQLSPVAPLNPEVCLARHQPCMNRNLVPSVHAAADPRQPFLLQHRAEP